jgi:hypothetical protein
MTCDVFSFGLNLLIAIDMDFKLNLWLLTTGLLALKLTN